MSIFFAVAPSLLTLRPPFVTGEELSQSDWRSTCMGTSSVSNGVVAGYYWSWSMSCIHNEVVAACPSFYAVACSYLSLWPSFATGDEWSQNDWRSTFMGTINMSNNVAGLSYWSWSMSCIHNAEVVAAMPIFLCCCLFLLVTMAIICHRWWMEPKWLEKHIHGYRQYVK
jgi:hypothetical protein